MHCLRIIQKSFNVKLYESFRAVTWLTVYRAQQVRRHDAEIAKVLKMQRICKVQTSLRYCWRCVAINDTSDYFENTPNASKTFSREISVITGHLQLFKLQNMTALRFLLARLALWAMCCSRRRRRTYFLATMNTVLFLPGCHW